MRQKVPPSDLRRRPGDFLPPDVQDNGRKKKNAPADEGASSLSNQHLIYADTSFISSLQMVAIVKKTKQQKQLDRTRGSADNGHLIVLSVPSRLFW